jgi:hypothetical protein
MRRVARRVSHGLEQPNFHDLRRTFASRADRNRTPRLVVKKMAGWTSNSVSEHHRIVDSMNSAALIPDCAESSMRVKLVWIERDFRGKELSKREEILRGEISEESRPQPYRSTDRLWLANCYFSQDSSGFPVLLRFCDARSGRSFHPLHR